MNIYRYAAQISTKVGQDITATFDTKEQAKEFIEKTLKFAPSYYRTPVRITELKLHDIDGALHFYSTGNEWSYAE